MKLSEITEKHRVLTKKEKNYHFNKKSNVGKYKQLCTTAPEI